MITTELLTLAVMLMLLGVLGLVSRCLKVRRRMRRIKKCTFEFRVDYWSSVYNAWHGEFYDRDALCTGYLLNVNKNEQLAGFAVKATAVEFDKAVGLWRMNARRVKAPQGNLSAKLVRKVLRGWMAEVANSEGIVLLRYVDNCTNRNLKVGDIVEVAGDEQGELYVPEA